MLYMYGRTYESDLCIYWYTGICCIYMCLCIHVIHTHTHAPQVHVNTLGYCQMEAVSKLAVRCTTWLVINSTCREYAMLANRERRVLLESREAACWPRSASRLVGKASRLPQVSGLNHHTDAKDSLPNSAISATIQGAWNWTAPVIRRILCRAV